MHVGPAAQSQLRCFINPSRDLGMHLHYSGQPQEDPGQQRMETFLWVWKEGILLLSPVTLPGPLSSDTFLGKKP